MQPENKTETRSRDEAVEASSGNVFADLGLKHPEELAAKAVLAQRICDILSERKLTPIQAASVLGVDRPKVSALMRGELERFSLDRLFRFLNALDRDVEIVIRPARRAGEAGTRVISS